MTRITTRQFVHIASRILDAEEQAIENALNLGSAESALAAPYAEFAGHIRYPNPVQRAAIACSRIIRNHPLPDGNKRTGFVVMSLMLDEVDLYIAAHPTATAEQVEALAAGTLSEDDWVDWVHKHVMPYPETMDAPPAK